MNELFQDTEYKPMLMRSGSFTATSRAGTPGPSLEGQEPSASIHPVKTKL